MMKKQRKPDLRGELLLAHALAAANDAGLRHCTGGPFFAENEAGDIHLTPFSDGAITCCCAAGALEIAGKIRDATALPRRLEFVCNGNDAPAQWSDFAADRGESLGWAFRQAMTENA